MTSSTPRQRRATAADGEAALIRPLQDTDWPAIEALFGTNGACGGCWCMWWRVPRGGRAWEAAKGATNREAFRSLVEAGRVHGLLAFVDGRPVAWCCFGPRADFPRVGTVKALQRQADPGAWAIVCFYIPAAWRGAGLGRRLARAATDRALELGATEVEAWPVAPQTPSTPIPAAFAWTGVPAQFADCTMSVVSGPDASRPILLRRR